MKHNKKIVHLFIYFLLLSTSLFSFLGCGDSSAEKYKSKDKAVKQVVANVSENVDNSKKELVEDKKKDTKPVKAVDATKNKKPQEKMKTVVNRTSKTKVTLNDNKNVKDKNSIEVKAVKPSVVKPKEKKDTFILIISNEAKGYLGKKPKIIAQKELKVDNSKTIMTYLRDNFDMEDNGGFLYRIGEFASVYPMSSSDMTEEQKQNKIMGIDWFIYVDGKKNPEGANDMYVKAGQKIMIDYHEWDKREVSAPQ